MEQQNQSNLFSELSFDHTARQHLRSLASWAMILVVVALIGYLINIITLFTTPKLPETSMEGFGNALTSASNSKFFDFLFIAIGLLLNYFLFRFARQARAAVDGYDQQSMASGFNNLKAYFMAMTILLIIVFVIFLLVITFYMVSQA